MSFSSLCLANDLVRAIADQGYSAPTPIQSRAIPLILAGRDLLAVAQTGTGKTAAFTLPLLQRLATDKAQGGRRPRALVLTPTRELAAQVGDSIRIYGRYSSLHSTVIFGGVNINPQIAKLRRGIDILVATPGRLLDHVQQKTLDLSGIEFLVLDEADRMLDMGFIPDVRRILALLPRQRQNLLFSATFSAEIRTLANGLLNDPETIDVAPRNAPAEGISQQIHPVDQNRKQALLAHLVSTGNWQRTLVFTRTKHGADRLARQLARDGISTTAIHGNKSQPARTRALADFKQGKVRVLVATDIAARGIDIDQLPQVVNYDLPNVPQDYVHRIGRTGRAGHTGLAVSLVCDAEKQSLKDIQRLLGLTIPSSVVEGFAPTATGRAKPASPSHRAQPIHPQRRAPGRSAGPASQRRPQAYARRRQVP